MSHDLNIPWTPQNTTELQRILSFLAELDYRTVALNHTISGKLPQNLACAIPSPLPFPVPPQLKILRRVTVILTDPSQNYRLSALAAHYDILALRPTTEKLLQHAITQSADCDLVSLDLSQRFAFHFRHKTLSSSSARGVRFEICYAAGISTSSNSPASDAAIARRNLISNATSLIRALRGRGVIVSSEARRALEIRAPADISNLVTVWGLAPERGREAVGREAWRVVIAAEMKRRSHRGVVDVIYGGEVIDSKKNGKVQVHVQGLKPGRHGGSSTGRTDTPPSEPGHTKNTHTANSETGVHAAKRKHEIEAEGEGEEVATSMSMSKSERKRRARAARLAATATDAPPSKEGDEGMEGVLQSTTIL